MCCFAQSDTTYLGEVRVYGLPVTRYAVGAKVDQFTAGTVGTLSDKLSTAVPLYIKSYGNNQLATISIRGTTASQTAVLWNGININSPTLGQSDLALLPLFLFDEISVRYGGSSALYGSDAIGGSVLLGQASPVFTRSVNLRLQQQVAGFGRTDTGIGAAWGGDRWQFETKAIYTYLRNDFPFHSPAVGYVRRQNNASVRNYGIDQRIHYRINDHQFIGFEGMYTDNHRQIQPPVTNNDSHEVLDDRNTRVSLNYHNETRGGILTATAAYVYNDEDYINETTSTNRSGQFVVQTGFEQNYGPRFDVRYGLSYGRFHARSDNFDDNLVEYRLDGFISARYLVSPGWLMNLNLRQALYDGRDAPFAPSLGTEIHVVDDTASKLSLRGQVSRAYRVPTLNDRYWIPGGNPSLKPEDAWQVEAGIQWNRSVRRFSIETDLLAYRGWVSKMILWRPSGSIWSPANLQQVDLWGVEASVGNAWKLEQGVVRVSLQYALTRSVNSEPLIASDPSTVDKQLPYVPFHSARMYLSAGHAAWSLYVNADYTSRRYTTLDNIEAYSLKPFILVDTGLMRRVQAGGIALEVSAFARNVFDVYYETLENHAMPGRNYGVRMNAKWGVKNKNST